MKIKRSGYYYILDKSHPHSGKQGYVAEHRLVMEKLLGRYLTKQEVVHHINGIRTDNHIKNLKLFATHGLHTLHGHPDIRERQKILFKGEHHSPKTEWKKNDPRLMGNKFRKGIVAWNKGKSWSEEHKQKLKISHQGKHTANKTSFKKGQTAWNKGMKRIGTKVI